MSKAKAQLPVLSELIANLADVATKFPRTAAIELALAVQHDWRRGVDPYGQPWAPVRVTDGLSRRYDPNRTIAYSYEPRVSGTDAQIVSEHKGSAALQKAYKRRPGRRSHPTEGEGLGTWQKRFQRMNRYLLIGARIRYQMTPEQYKEFSGRAALRKQERFERRNAERVRMGLKPLAPRRQRSDRARIEALAAKAIGGAP